MLWASDIALYSIRSGRPYFETGPSGVFFRTEVMWWCTVLGVLVTATGESILNSLEAVYFSDIFPQEKRIAAFSKVMLLTGHQHYNSAWRCGLQFHL